MTPDDEVGFRVFVAGRSAALLRAAQLLTGDAHAAQDLLQEALARLVPQWNRVDDPEAYTRVAMHRLAISRWRRHRFGRELSHSQVPDRPSRGTDPERGVDDRMVLREALLRLTPRQRAVLVCRHVEDLDESTTAARLGISVGTVRSTNHRALARLRQLAPELAAPAPALTPAPATDAPVTEPTVLATDPTRR